MDAINGKRFIALINLFLLGIETLEIENLLPCFSTLIMLGFL